MQIVPDEAGEDVGVTSKMSLQNPTVNSYAGTRHLRRLLRKYDGQVVLAVAAYNAGEGRISRWIKRYGDPRYGGSGWVHSIPFQETRIYVQVVIGTVSVLNDCTMIVRRCLRQAIDTSLFLRRMLS